MPEPNASNDGPDTITVVAVVRDEVAADRAEPHVTVQGSSLVTGDMALTRAREVGQLVSDLKAVGVDEADITLESVRANTSTGLIGRNSSATYALRVVCRDLKRLPDVLGAVTSQKNVGLGHIAWGYPDDEERWLTLLDEGVRRAKDKATRVASRLGITLLGVHRFEESRNYARLSSQDTTYLGESDALPNFGRARPRRIGDDDLRMDVANATRIAVRVEVEYRVSGFTNTSKEAAQP